MQKGPFTRLANTFSKKLENHAHMVALYTCWYNFVAERDELSESVARDVAFHMTDWLENLAEFYAFCAHPEATSQDEITDLLTGFLLHVPNHVAAAAKLLTGIGVSDIFGVGSTADTEESN